MTIGDIFRTAKRQLQLLYSEQEIKAMVRMLLRHYVGLTATQIYAEVNYQLQNADGLLLTASLRQLATGRPLQYVIGETEFCGLPFEVNEQVLIPRPETEELVHWAAEELLKFSEPDILDLCTGSGCIAVAVAKQIPEARVSACDISTEALEIAQRNAVKNGVMVNFFPSDILNPRSSIVHPVYAFGEADRKSSILSNPPYVRNSEKPFMHNNVLDYEPHMALFVEDNDPLIFYRAIATIARRCLIPEGFVMVEINEALAAETMQVFVNAGFTRLNLRQDMNGKDRILRVGY